MKIRIYIKDGELVLYIERYKNKTNYKWEIGLFYPYYFVKNKIYDYKLKKRFKIMGYPIVKCQGCGSGISEWEIDEPNGQQVKIKVCDRCVGFYDYRLTRQRLEIIWDTQREGCYL